MKKRKFAWKYGGLAVILLVVASLLAVSVAAESMVTPWIGVDEQVETQDETTTDSTGSEQPSGGTKATAEETLTTEEVPKPKKKKGCGSIVSFGGIGISILIAGAACIATKAGRRN